MTSAQTVWCHTCKARQQVMDEYATDTGGGRPSFSAYVARPLSCGHDAGAGGAPPFRARFKPDATLVERLVALQQAARDGVIL